jgi:hypothetical protein
MRYTPEALVQHGPLFLAAIERGRQARPQAQGGEGTTARGDDTYENGELALAACAYATPLQQAALEAWPEGWGPCPPMHHLEDPGRVDDLVKAAALLLAELDRLARGYRAAGVR